MASPSLNVQQPDLRWRRRPRGVVAPGLGCVMHRHWREALSTLHCRLERQEHRMHRLLEVTRRHSTVGMVSPYLLSIKEQECLQMEHDLRRGGREMKETLCLQKQRVFGVVVCQSGSHPSGRPWHRWGFPNHIVATTHRAHGVGATCSQ